MSQPSPLSAARQRAQALVDSGDLGQARSALEHAVEVGRANLGEDDPEVLLTAQLLASVHQRRNDPSGARRVLEEAYAAGQWRLGDADPVMLGISFDLGVVAEEMENRHEARRAFGRVLEHGPAALGADHWSVARARFYLGDDKPAIPTQREAPQDQILAVRPQQAEVTPRYFGGAEPQHQPRPQPMPQVVAVPQVVSGPPAVTASTVDSAYGRKAPALFAVIAATLGVIIAVVALVVVLANRGDDPGSDVPTLSGPAPGDARIRDYGSSVQLSWTDPANGRASFVITGGHPGEQLRPMGQVGPTTTSFDLKGLNADLEYCFAVVAYYSTSQFSPSPQVCTARSTSGGRPAPSQS